MPYMKQEGPAYPDLGSSVAAARRRYLNGTGSRRDYGLAVSAAIRAKQRAELARVKPGRRVHCASGTDHNTGEAIHAAVQQQIRAQAQAAALRDIRDGVSYLTEWSHSRFCQCAWCEPD